jgi:hypothetical protein
MGKKAPDEWRPMMGACGGGRNERLELTCRSCLEYDHKIRKFT